MKSETKDLTDAELNLMVAECEGWRFFRTESISQFWKCPEGYEYSDPPDYCASHNAILPCVRGLLFDESWAFSDCLERLCNLGRGRIFGCVTAPARTLVLAYLKAKGKI